MSKRTVKAWGIVSQSGLLCVSLTRDRRKGAEDACALLMGRSWVGMRALGCRSVRLTITYDDGKRPHRRGRGRKA